MIDFILSFLGLRPSGFKRQNAFFNFFGKITTHRFNKKSINYLASCFFSCAILLSSYYDASYTRGFEKIVAPYFVRAKCFVSELIEFPKIISEYMHLKGENSALRREIDDLKIRINTSKNMEIEYLALRNSVNLKYSISNYKFIEKILGFDRSAYESFLIISATHANTNCGGVVISSDGLIGVIFDSYNEVARVMTIADKKLYVPVRSDSGEHLILSGNGKSKMISVEIKQSETGTKTNLNAGDILYTSGEGGVFQENIPVAKILKIMEDGAVLAEPVAHIANTGFVWIVDPFFKEP